MATIFMEPSETGALEPYIDITNFSVSASQVAGAWSSYSLYASAGTSTITFGLDSAVSTFYGQFRMYTTDNFVGSSEDIINFTSPNNTTQCSIGVVSGGQISAFRGTTTTLLGSGSTVLQPNTWYLIQFKVVLSDTVGEFLIKVNETTEVNLTSQDTISDGASGTCDRIKLLGFSSDNWFDDVIINDGTGTANNSYPDSLGIEALMPNAAGDNTGMLRGGADSGSNYGQVDEKPANDATDYVYDTVTDEYDIYNIPATRWTTVKSVNLVLTAQKNDAASANIAHVVKADTDADTVADTLYTGSDVALSTSWTAHPKNYNQQPDSTDWTPAKVNALQVGAKAR